MNDTEKEAVTDSRKVASVEASVIKQTLSDGSEVYNVLISDGYGIAEIYALNESRALNCAAVINRAIRIATGF